MPLKLNAWELDAYLRQILRSWDNLKNIYGVIFYWVNYSQTRIITMNLNGQDI